ncbi:MAG: hypothetical protein PHW79_07760 [Candidatus Marinimicrobia bacterium]|jgi:hypothetical protein|nr:hypothetical protein [Candidatus Neomarinimicrobiota bacterium]
MKNKKVIAIVIFYISLFGVSTFAESPTPNSVILSGRITIDMVIMDDLKDFFKEYKSEYPVPVKTTANFPPWFDYQVQIIKLQINQDIRIGPFIEYASTGSRLHYKDYSGEIRTDFLVNHIGGGIMLDVATSHRKKIVPVVYTGISYHKTHAKMTESIRIYDEEEKQSINLTSTNIIIDQGVGFEMTYKYFIFAPYIGYQIQIDEKPLHLKGNPKAQFGTEDTDAVGVNWTGLRFGIQVGLR